MSDSSSPDRRIPVPPPLPQLKQRSDRPINPYGPDEVPASADLYGIQGEKAIPDSFRRNSVSSLPGRTVPPQRIDVNRASRETLAALPRVGSMLALQIVHQREAGGVFHSMDDFCTRCHIKPHIRVAIEEFLLFDSATSKVSVPLQAKKGRRID